MGLERQLERWVQARLIDAEQAAHIRSFEAAQRRPTLLYAGVILAALAVAIGLVSIVAANWDAIPGRAKIAVALLGVLGLGHLVAHPIRRGPPWLGEATLVVLYGWVLASIALIGQVYQLGGSAPLALSVWNGLCFVALAQGRSTPLGLVWLAGLQATYGAWCAELGEQGEDERTLALMALFWVPLACIALGRTSWLRRHRPEHAALAGQVGWAELVLCGSAGTLGFYVDHSADALGTYWVMGCLASAAGTAWLAWATRPGPAQRSTRSLLGAAFLSLHLPLSFPHDDLPLLGFLAFLALWWLVAVCAYQQGRARLLHFATGVLALRLLVAYIELFGSLLDTGLGLVLGGVLALLLIWVWARKRRTWDRDLGRTTPAGEPRA